VTTRLNTFKKTVGNALARLKLKSFLIIPEKRSDEIRLIFPRVTAKKFKNHNKLPFFGIITLS